MAVNVELHGSPHNVNILAKINFIPWQQQTNHRSYRPNAFCLLAKHILCWNTKCIQMLYQSPIHLLEPCRGVSTTPEDYK